MRTKLILLLATIMGGVTTYLFYDYVQQFEVETVISDNMVEILVAKDAIKKNERITSGMLELKQVPDMGVHPQAMTDLSLVEGMYATSRIEPGESILSHRIKNEKDESVFVSRKVREGHRAVSIGVNFVQSVSNLIEPEDYVDVLHSETHESSSGQTVADTQVVLNHVRVLGVGRKLVESETEEDYVEYHAVTLEVNLQDAVKLTNASQTGDIQLVLHGRLIPNGEETTASNQ